MSKQRIFIGVALLLCACVYAGEMWKSIIAYKKADRAIDEIQFIDDRIGWASAGFVGILKTEDGGKTWQQLDSNIKSDKIYSLWFVNNDKGWAVGTRLEAGIRLEDSKVFPVILTTNDGGQSWITQMVLRERERALTRIYFLDKRHGWSVGGTSDTGKGLMFATSDGGQSWKEIQSDAFDSAMFRDVYFKDLEHGWIVGNSKSGIVHTEDGGGSWRVIPLPDSPRFLNRLHFIDSENGWAVGGRDGLYRTTDGGRTWDQVRPSSEYNEEWLYNITFADKMRGWICCEKGILFSTQDGGKTWMKEVLPKDDLLEALAINKIRIMVGGADGKIFVRHFKR